MINLIAAITYYPKEDQFIIAANGDLPHNSPEDIARFQKLTTGGTVIMGRETYDTLGQALPDRTNIVLSRDPMFRLSNAFVARSLEEALECPAKYGYSSDIWIIGGGQVYREAIEKDIPDRLYISEMRGHWETDNTDKQIGNPLSLLLIHGAGDEVVTFPRINWEYYKALYIEQFEDHSLKILSKTSLDVL
jgi:dihydrofolate reductase